MTDKEIALEIGRRVISAQFRIAAMAAELSMHRDDQNNEIPWRAHVEQNLGRLLDHTYQEHIAELQRGLSEANPEEILRILYSSIDKR